MAIPLVELKYLLKNSCSRETAYNPDLWSPENPFFGHCAVIALIVQDLNGGKIQGRYFPEEWIDNLGSKSHYWNILQDGILIDLSRDQFPKEFPYDDFMSGKIGRVMSNTGNRNRILAIQSTFRRYELLKDRVKTLIDANPLFTDKKFRRSWELAFSGESTCPKMRFACLVYDGKKLVTQSTNKNFCTEFGKERLCAFDGSFCIRMDMPSRTDATLGDCGHAPIWCIKQVFDLGYKPKDLPKLNFYESGFKPDGSPWWREDPSYTCTYCQNIFAIFGLDKIYGAFGGAWHPLWTKDSLYSSTEYAKGLKKA